MPDRGSTGRLPALFVGHGSPAYVVEDNAYGAAWQAVAQRIPSPRGILCVSAHWETDGTRVTAMEAPRTIHDFYGFPEPMYAIDYPAPGAPDLAAQVIASVTATEVRPDFEWGLDHGTWAVLIRMYPHADVPVCQLSLDRNLTAAQHYRLGRQLRGLRGQGVLVLGSGNIVHNLRAARPGSDGRHGYGYDWALDFDAAIAAAVERGDDDAVIGYRNMGQTAGLAVPTDEHFLPLLYVLGARHQDDATIFFAEGFELGSLSMRSVGFGLSPSGRNPT